MKRFIIWINSCKSVIATFLRYITIGLFNTTLCLCIMYVGSCFGLHYLTYTVLGYGIAMVFSFFMNFRYTFRANDLLLKRLFLFLSVSITNLFIVESMQYFLIERYNWSVPVTVLMGMAWYVVAGFLVNLFVVYREKG